MKIEIDEDVQRVAEFMQANIVAERLVGVSQAISNIAPILWARHGSERIAAMTLTSEFISKPDTQVASNE